MQICTRSIAALLALALLVVSQAGGQDKPKEEFSKDELNLKPVQGRLHRLVSVDRGSKFALVEVTGKQYRVQITEDTKFIGPDGVSDKRSGDDRFKPGALVGLILRSDTAKEIHLPFRNKAEREKYVKDKAQEAQAKDAKDKDTKDKKEAKDKPKEN